MTKKQIIDYVMNSPENTNRVILSQMIDEVGGEDNDIVTLMVLDQDNYNLTILKAKKNIPINLWLPKDIDTGEDYDPTEEFAWVSMKEYYEKKNELINNNIPRVPYAGDDINYARLNGDLTFVPHEDDVIQLMHGFYDILITFDPNGGTYNYDDEGYGYYYIGDEVDKYDVVPNPPLSSQSLLGWAESSTALEPLESIIATEDMTLYAVWGEPEVEGS